MQKAKFFEVLRIVWQWAESRTKEQDDWLWALYYTRDRDAPLFTDDDDVQIPATAAAITAEAAAWHIR